MAANNTIDSINTDALAASIKSTFSQSFGTQTQSQYTVNIANTSVIGVNIVEREPPKDPYSGPFDFAGFGFGLPSTPRTSRGVIQGTAIGATNLQLSHGCQVYIGNLGGLLTSSLGFSSLTVFPPSRIQASIQLRISFGTIVNEFRMAINEILATLNLDPTGIISYAFSQLKALIRMLDYWTFEIRQLVSDIQALVQFIVQLEQIIQYLLNLPAELLAFVKDCITGFFSSIKNLPNQFANLPGQVANQTVGQLFNSIQNTVTSGQNAINIRITTASSKSVFQKNNLTLNSSASDISLAIANNTPNSQSILANTQSGQRGLDANSYPNSSNTASDPNAKIDSKKMDVIQATKNMDLIVDTISVDWIQTGTITANVINAAVIYADSVNANDIQGNQVSNVVTIELYAPSPTIILKASQIYAQQICYRSITANTITANTIYVDSIYSNSEIYSSQTLQANQIYTMTISANNYI